MGSDPSATLCFGYAFFGEEETFPWSDGDVEYDIDDWWMEVNGYVNPFPCPYDTYGMLLPNIQKEDEEAYWNHRREWRNANPVPVHVVTCYSSDYPCGYVLTTREVEFRSPDGGPDKLDEAIFSRAYEASQVLKDFCEKYGVETDGDPAWYLTSFYG